MYGVAHNQSKLSEPINKKRASFGWRCSKKIPQANSKNKLSGGNKNAVMKLVINQDIRFS